MKVVEIGKENFWSYTEMRDSLGEFLTLYDDRPIRDNSGGMKIPHLFMTWFALKKLQPKVIVESGVWLGQGTWLFEQVCPRAKLFCIEPEQERIQYRSKKAIYYTKDFSEIYWGNMPKEDTLLFFDDHQNAFSRVITAYEYGFRHLMFEDNYPAQQGDCYSLKKVFDGVGYSPTPHQSFSERVIPNLEDAEYLREVLEIYFEMPPIIRLDKTRWGDEWGEKYPTPPSLIEDYVMPSETPHGLDPYFKFLVNEEKNEIIKVHLEEFLDYTWICYVRLEEKEETQHA